jgi:hypothetical protein
MGRTKLTTVFKPLLFHALFFCISYFVVCFAIDKVADGIALSKGITRNPGTPWFFRLLVGALVGICSQIIFYALQPVMNEMLARIIAIAIGAASLGFFAGRQVTWINQTKAIVFTACLSILGAVAVTIYEPSVGRFVVSAMLGVAIALALEVPDYMDTSDIKPSKKVRSSPNRSAKPVIETPPDRLVLPPDQIEVNTVKQPEIRNRRSFDLKTIVTTQSIWMLVFIATFFLSGCSATLVTYDGHSPLPPGSLKVLSKVVGADQSKGRLRIGKSMKSGENMLVLYDNQNQGGNWFPSTGDEVVVEGQKSAAQVTTFDAKTVRLCTTVEKIQAVTISSWPYLIALPLLLAGLVRFVIGPSSPKVSPSKKTSNSLPKTQSSPGSFTVIAGLSELQVPLPTHTSGLIVIGRDIKTCTSLGYDSYVVLDNDAVDPVHAEIRFRPDRDAWYIVGGVTTHETVLDGEPVLPRVGKRLKPGSRVDIGGGQVVLEWTPSTVFDEESK